MHVAQHKSVPGGDAQQGTAVYPGSNAGGKLHTIRSPGLNVRII